jgi:hypothetical protein
MRGSVATPGYILPVALGIILASEGWGRAKVVPVSPPQTPPGNYIVVRAEGVDDDVNIWVNDKLVATCSYSTYNSECSVGAKVFLGDATEAKVRFQLKNHVYSHCINLGCGKCTGHFFIENAKGFIEWQDLFVCDKKAGCARGNDAFICYDREFLWTK